MENVTVATFNIRSGLGTDGVRDLERTAAVINESGADLVALQEVDRRLERSSGLDQAATLAELTGLRISFWPTLRRGGGEYGIALGTRDVADARFEPLPRIGDEEPRGAIVASWNGLGIVATHLSTVRSAKAAQLRAVARLAREAGDPAVVLGDFNTSVRRLRDLRAGGFVGGRYQATYGLRLGSRHIDHILVSPGVRMARSWTVASPASDHLLLAAEIASA